MVKETGDMHACTSKLTVELADVADAFVAKDRQTSKEQLHQHNGDMPKPY